MVSDIGVSGDLIPVRSGNTDREIKEPLTSNPWNDYISADMTMIDYR